MRKKRLWMGVGASVLATTGLTVDANSAPLTPAHMTSTSNIDQASKTGSIMHGQTANAAKVWLAAAEGGEGGEGGEAGIDATAIDRDPVVWNLALSIIAAHYLAGQQAYAAGEKEAGAQMFAHGLSEVYLESEDTFKARGFGGLEEALQTTVDLAVDKAPPRDVAIRVAKVLDLINSAETKGPDGSGSTPVNAKVLADLLNRAAAQYRVIGTSTEYESYLDGLGFSLAAKALADKTLTALSKSAPDAAKALQEGLDLALRAYPAARRPADLPVEAGAFQAAASRAQLASSSLK